MKTDADPADVCIFCGLLWQTIFDQLKGENGHDYALPGIDDDCDDRKRKQNLKSFW